MKIVKTHRPTACNMVPVTESHTEMFIIRYVDYSGMASRQTEASSAEGISTIFAPTLICRQNMTHCFHLVKMQQKYKQEMQN